MFTRKFTNLSVRVNSLQILTELIVHIDIFYVYSAISKPFYFIIINFLHLYNILFKHL